MLYCNGEQEAAITLPCTHAGSAICYAQRYPDLAAAFCPNGECDIDALYVHYRDTGGPQEGRIFGCEGCGSGGGPDVPAFIGKAPVPESDFSGCVERVLIYREALTQDQVQQAVRLTDDPAL